MAECDLPKPPPTNTSGRKVTCVKLSRELPGLDAPPMKGPLGQRIFDGVSAEGWQLWVEQSKMIINEYRLSMIDPKARETLKIECEKFFFGEGSALPPDYRPPPKK